MNVFGAVGFRKTALSMSDEIIHSSQWTIVFIDLPWMQKGIDLFRQRMDKEWGLVDCISMVVAEQNNIRDIMTADHHFEQAGFNCFLK